MKGGVPPLKVGEEIKQGEDMEERQRTRSQGPPSLSENNELNKWDSLQDPVRIEREKAEARRLARQTSMVTSTAENKVESSEIPQKQPDKESESHQNIEHTPTSGEIPPKEQKLECITLQLGEILPKQQKKRAPRPSSPKLGEIPQQKAQQLIDSTAVGEGLIVNLNRKDGQQDLPQVDTAEHYLDNNFSDVMRSSALGSNVSSLFNTTAFNTTNNEHKVTLDWQKQPHRKTTG